MTLLQAIAEDLRYLVDRLSGILDELDAVVGKRPPHAPKDDDE